MKKFALTCLLLLNFVAVGQSNFDAGFREGFKNGYCYSNQSSGYCSPPLPPLPPLPQINENRNSYKDGEYRGFIYGQARRKTDDNNSSNNNVNPNSLKFGTYVPQNPVELMAMTGINLQRKYDLRANWTQNKIDELGDLYSRLFDEQNFPNINIQNVKSFIRSKHVDYFNSLRGTDFGNDYVFNNVVNGFNSIIELTYINYNRLVEAENKSR